jgi:hypothetical protein
MRQYAIWLVERFWARQPTDYFGHPFAGLDASLAALTTDEPLHVTTLPSESYYGTAFHPDEFPSYFFLRVRTTDDRQQFIQVLTEKVTPTGGSGSRVEHGTYFFGASFPLQADAPPFPRVTAEEARQLATERLGMNGIILGEPVLVNIPFPVLDFREMLYQFGPSADLDEPCFVRLHDGRFFRTRLDYERFIKQNLALPNDFLPAL